MVQKANTIEELLQDCPVNSIIGDNLIRAWSKINSHKYLYILCSISGGSDSDDMLDIVYRCDKSNKVKYVWFDTGLEYSATKEHLKYLENKYDIIHFLRREMLDFTAFPVFFVSNLLLVQRKKYYFNRATVSRNCSIVL